MSGFQKSVKLYPAVGVPGQEVNPGQAIYTSDFCDILLLSPPFSSARGIFHRTIKKTPDLFQVSFLLFVI